MFRSMWMTGPAFVTCNANVGFAVVHHLFHPLKISPFFADVHAYRPTFDADLSSPERNDFVDETTGESSPRRTPHTKSLT